MKAAAQENMPRMVASWGVIFIVLTAAPCPAAPALNGAETGTTILQSRAVGIVG